MAGLAANSSFAAEAGLDARAAGRYRGRLDQRAQSFIEALCHREMRALGYALELNPGDIEAVIAAGPGEETVHREALRPYHWSAQREAEERARLAAFESASGFDPRYVLFKRAFDRLAASG